MKSNDKNWISVVVWMQLKITCVAVAWLGRHRHCPDKVQAGMPAEGRMYYDLSGNENNSNKSLGDFLGSANTGNGSGVCSTDGSIPLTGTKSKKSRNRT